MEINKKTGGLVIAVALVIFGVGGFFAYRYFTNLPDTSDDGFASLTSHKKDTTKKPVEKQSDKISTKIFTFTAKGSSGVNGDGSATLKADLTSFGLRLVNAPGLKLGENYEAYIVLKEGTDPQLIGTFVPVKTTHEKYVAGGAGATSWYQGEKVIITKRGAKEAKPGTVVAEGSLSESKK